MIFNLGVLSYEEATSDKFWSKIVVKIDFTLWLNDVNKYMQHVYGVTMDGIPDQDWYAYYRSGDTPEEAVELVIDEVEKGEWL